MSSNLIPVSKKSSEYILVWSKKLKAIEKLGGCCIICGENRPWLIVFHHKIPEQKITTIKNLITLRWSLIESELSKCVPFCENCHRYQHSIGVTGKGLISKRYALEYRQQTSCTSCGYSEYLGALDFHHNESKKEGIGSLIRNSRYKSIWDIPEEIKKEIDTCTVLCSNCHKDKHFDHQRYFRNLLEINKKMEDYSENTKPLDKMLVLALFKSGLRQIDIAKHFGCVKSTISMIIKNYV